jgi:hypothetical protein
MCFRTTLRLIVALAIAAFASSGAHADQALTGVDEEWEAPSFLTAGERIASRADGEAHVLVPTYEKEPDLTPDLTPGPQPLAPFLPIWGDAIREQGYELPLPMGLSVNYVNVKRDIEVEDIKVSVDGEQGQSVTNFLRTEADSDVEVVIGRFDVWILPFLSIYGYGGWQWNDSSVEVAVTIPTPGPAPDLQFTIQDNGTIDGPIYGGGTSLALGYESFFMVSSVDFAFAEFDEFDSDFEGRIFSTRVGRQATVQDMSVSMWIGGNYFDTELTIKGNVDLPSGQTVSFAVDQGPVHPWNGLVGANVGAGERIDLMFEYGFNFDDVTILTGGATIRF